MYEHSRGAAPSGHREGYAGAALLKRVHEELAAVGRTRIRSCPRCGRPIRAGQDVTRVFGTAVHRRCDGLSTPVRQAL